MYRAIVAVALVVFAGTTIADQWLPATPQTFVSYFGAYRLTVFPREVSSPLAYFEDLLKGAQPAGQPADGPLHCEATMERLVDNHYVEQWRRPLVNDVSPVTALVSDASGAFVTFDNWHSMGCCGDTVVIYNSAGNVVRKFSLVELLGKTEVSKLARTVSSTYWGGEHQLGWVENSEVVNLKVIVNGKFPGDPDVEYTTMPIRLHDGEILVSKEAPPN